MERYQLYIDGLWADAQGGATYGSIDPYAGEPWAEVPDATSVDVDHAVKAARAAFTAGPWAETPGRERARLMHKLADLVEDRGEHLARVETRDNGKLLRETRGQAGFVAQYLRYFAGYADKVFGEVVDVGRSSVLAYTRREPIGVIAAIVPWNSPLTIAMFAFAPAIATGNTFVLKPSPIASCSSLEFAALVDEAGFPAGVFNVVTGARHELGDELVSHPDVGKVVFVGGTQTGARVASRAGALLKPVLLELGGKSPNVVFEDADLQSAANGVVAGIFAAAGQTCVAGSRLVVHESIAEPLTKLVTERATEIRLGDPADPASELGPLAYPEHWERVDGFVRSAVAGGATVACGGGRPAASPPSSTFYAPTVLTGVQPDMQIAREEVFGPVLAALTFASEEEAIAVANDSPYGLTAGVWSSDIRRAHRVAHALRAGTVWINDFRAISPALPFGGVGASGFGRVNGTDGLREYTQPKAIWVELDDTVRDPFKMG